MGQARLMMFVPNLHELRNLNLIGCSTNDHFTPGSLHSSTEYLYAPSVHMWPLYAYLHKLTWTWNSFTRWLVGGENFAAEVRARAYQATWCYYSSTDVVERSITGL